MEQDMSETNFLIKCDHCDTIFKLQSNPKILENNNIQMFTDFGDAIEINMLNMSCKCLKCNLVTDLRKHNNFIRTDKWIADMIFKIKG